MSRCARCRKSYSGHLRAGRNGTTSPHVFQGFVTLDELRTGEKETP